LFILDKMEQIISGGRQDISSFAPRIYTLQIPVDKIRDLIGPGGKMIRSIIDQTGVKIDVDDTGKVNVASSDGPSAQKAIQMINDLTAVPEIGKTYLGKVVRIAEFGAFVEIIPGTDGLLHISEIAEHRVRSVEDELKEGDQVLVKVLAMEGNRIKLSRKAILREQRAKMAPAQHADGGEHAEAGGGGGAPSPLAAPAAGSEETITFEGGGDFAEDEAEPNFNREDANRETVGASSSGGSGRHDRPRHGGGGGGGSRRRGGRGRGPRGDRGPRGGGGGDRGNR
jgi:polyribonucleotide nucleotidyltransferase